MAVRLPFVLAATEQGTLIVNRYDFHANPELNGTFGIGLEILDTANYSSDERDTVAKLLQLRRSIFGDGVVALDVGANIGAHTVAWSRVMTDWGQIFAFEPQEWTYYALAGNLAINNCLNAHALNVAVGATIGTIDVPSLAPNVPANFGGLELLYMSHGDRHQSIGVEIDRSKTATVPVITIDSLNLSRLDLLKIDVEGMESDVLHGAASTISRYKPILFIEWVKSDQDGLVAFCTSLGYDKFCLFGMNLIAIHPDDPSRAHVTFDEVKK
jgi:FkbM family methyltransferase